MSIVCTQDACNAAQQMAGRAFLEAEGSTPVLPLQGCDVARCQCRYAHSDDRRTASDDNDRRLPASLQSELYPASENIDRRQRRRGRRRSDLT
ncbi:hypothetical protein [Parahaliea aestuarii]|uniref:Uncharacterized protein n=1 Tax=Parahaliea aestuarii TaxID=1852021 RepID=A0A5C9A1R2_9GAMM|nr:hypothetical protein [Parahaliea aestuarii]TXS93291.1 hypothetical protein FVW59_05470 [Parahaliea aestuarii]